MQYAIHNTHFLRDYLLSTQDISITCYSQERVTQQAKSLYKACNTRAANILYLLRFHRRHFSNVALPSPKIRMSKTNVHTRSPIPSPHFMWKKHMKHNAYTRDVRQNFQDILPATQKKAYHDQVDKGHHGMNCTASKITLLQWCTTCAYPPGVIFLEFFCIMVIPHCHQTLSLSLNTTSWQP